MSSFGNAIENWSIRNTGGISDLQQKLISDGCARSSSPIKTMAAVVDSAYSSFSGSSYVTDYQPFQHANCHLNAEQISYLDSDYVKAIYSPSAADQRNFQQNVDYEDCSSKNYPSNRTTRLSNSSQVPLMRNNYFTTIQHFEQSDKTREFEDHFNHKSKRSPTSTSDLSSPEHKFSRHYIEDNSPTWVRDSIQGEWDQSSVTSCNRSKKDHPHFTSYLAKSRNSNCIVNENISPCVINTDYDQKDLETCQLNNVEREEQSPSNILNLFTDCPSEAIATKSTRRSLNELELEKNEVRSGSWKLAQDTNCYNDEGTNREVEDLAHYQMCKEQYQPEFQNMKDLECDSVGQWDIKCKDLQAKKCQTLYSRPSEELFEHPSKSLNRDDLQKFSKTHIQKDATIKSIPLLSQEQEVTIPLTSNLSALTREKITKASTPMLYHLAGGRNSSLVMLNFKHQPKILDSNKEPKNHPEMGNSATMQVPDPERPLSKTKSHTQLVDNSVIDCSECESTDGLTSSEETFMYDYREQLKIAQKKVLRETSFKRRDLQMSLPVRLKWNAPKRPSLDHVRSYSLSGSNDAKLVQPKTVVDNNHKKEEPEKSIISRIGGRKRLTKEQRKLCYSEPEKLDHLGVHNPFPVWDNEVSSQAKLGEHRMKSTDKERTLSSSNLSKTELKQIQHNALVEYMERKANQRPSSILQSQIQKQSGIKSSSEWKYLTNEMSSNDLPLPYYHRRSTGASSSYDATVTWNNRPLKMSQGEPIKDILTVDKAVNVKDKNYLDQSPLIDKCSFEDSSAADSQKYSKSVNHPQVPAGHLSSSTSSLSSNNHVYDTRLSSTMDSAAHELEKVSTARGRGKSMEELGTSDRIRLSVLSQSSEQLYHIKDPALGPPAGNVSTAVVHQDKQKSSPEPGSRPRQTSNADLLGIHRYDIAKSAHERHSRSLRANGASPGIESASTSSLQSHAETTVQSHTLKTDIEVVSHPTSMDDACSIPNISLEKTRHKCHSEEVLGAPSPLPIPCHLQPQAMTIHAARMNNEGVSTSYSKTLVPEKSWSQKPGVEGLDDISLLKVELISSIGSQLEQLCGEKERLLSEIGENANHGTRIEAVVKDVCKPNEYERYMMFIGDLEKVVSLLFCLSMRLARVENALSRIDKNTDAEEMQSLKERHSLLSRQREDAKDLKDNLDRRDQVVTGILAKYLSETQLQDYKHFVRLKTTYLIEQKDLDEKIKFLEGQLESLHTSIPH
ncbi:protein Shroom1 isoform X2 [Dendrobates tinctorius]|uniref:protein Shroom1 isoform X2 n=1 Tax=Dendrobates tinctorius TaxID=92724 RepID=UPI003CC9CFDE